MLNKKALAATAPGVEPLFVESVFQTTLYTGNGSTQTITNGIDLSGEGGLVWFKNRGAAADHLLVDTARGFGTNLTGSAVLRANLTNSQSTGLLTAYNPSATGFTISNDGAPWSANVNANTYASWTFRKAEKFFDVVTYTGTGSARTVSHNLGSVPGVIIIKRTSGIADWRVYHRSLGATKFLNLNATDAEGTGTGIFNDTAPTSTVFTVGDDTSTNGNGSTYVAYLFAHDAGGFGDAGDQSVIKCGSYTGNGSTTGPTVTLDWEPQWILIKNANNASAPWYLWDNMRGLVVGGSDAYLLPNASDAESSLDYCDISATGFQVKSSGSYVNGNGNTIIYIAIRRGPMKTPEAGTEVYYGLTRTGTGATTTITGFGFPPDLLISKATTSFAGTAWFDKLRGAGKQLYYDTSAESTAANNITSFNMDGVSVGSDGSFGALNTNTVPYVYWNFRRAPGFFDVVCYTGTGSARTVSHNLGVAPELMIMKQRSGEVNWNVYTASEGNTKALVLNTDGSSATSSLYWNNTSPTSSVFTVGSANGTNASGATYVAYLFASCPGVSSIGTYTGNGSSVTVTTGFQPRFVMVKRTDSTGNWIVGDSARGLIAGNDPYLLLNSTAAEDTDEDWVDISSTGFTVNETTANANVNTGTYIYLCIA